MRGKIPIMYLCIHKRVSDSTRGNIISKKKLIEIIGRLYHVEKRYAILVIEDLKIHGLFKDDRERYLKILPCTIDLEDTSKLYKSANFF